VLGHHSALPFRVVVVMEEQDDPIVRAAELVRVGGIREQGGEMPIAARSVQNRQPRFLRGIEAPRGDGRQGSGTRPGTVWNKFV
jgi:hypothetical protein